MGSTNTNIDDQIKNVVSGIITNVTSEAFNRLWTNLDSKILPKKVDVVEGYGLSKNDFTDELSAKLHGVEENANAYVHPVSGVLAGTYRSVTVDENGHITEASNPTTLAEYGVTEVPVNLLTGTIDIARLPHGALERCVVVEDDEARFALTPDDIQLGDTVKVTSTDRMYFVVDENQLGSEDGYQSYSAGTASSVEWSGVFNKPEFYPAEAHTHTVAEITDFPTSLKNPNAIKITGANVTYDGTTLTGTDEVTTYDGSEEISFDLVSTILATIKAVNNGALGSGFIMTPEDVDIMMGLAPAPEEPEVEEQPEEVPEEPENTPVEPEEPKVTEPEEEPTEDPEEEPVQP